VNHKRVVRIMREDNLPALQPKRFKITTNSNYKLEIYLNLAARMKLTAINQLWVADVTYIRLKAEFVYLTVILDGFYRKVVGVSICAPLKSFRETLPAIRHHHERMDGSAYPDRLVGDRSLCPRESYKPWISTTR